MTTETRFAEALAGLDAGTLAPLLDVMRLARDLEPGTRGLFLTDCLNTLDAPIEEGQTPRPASELLAPVLARWAGQVQS